MNCVGCTRTAPPLAGVGKTSDVMVIGDYTHNVETVIDEMFAGQAGRFLKIELANAQVDWTQCYMTKAVKCPAPDDRAPTLKEIKCCLPYLLEEATVVKPKYVLVFGGAALKATLGKVGITKERGKLFDWQGAQCVATISPGMVMRQPVYTKIFREDLNYFARLLDGKLSPPTDFKWTLVTTPQELLSMQLDCMASDYISYDVETTCLHDTDNGKLLLVGLGTARMNWVVPLDHKDAILNRELVVEVLNTILQANHVKKIAHNGKFDNRWLRSRGVHPYIGFDTFLASYCMNVTLPSSLKYLAKTRCGASDYDKDAQFNEAFPLWKLAEYCAFDAYYTRRLYPMLKADLLSDQLTARVFKHIVMPGARVLERMEHRGVYIDLPRLRTVTADYANRLTDTENELNAVVGRKINWNSPKQLADVLFKQLKLNPVDGESTRKSVLLRLVSQHDTVKLVLRYRQLSKAMTSFLVPWEKMLQHELGMGRGPRLHTTYNIAKTATGRLSSEVPNLQQVPRLTEIRSLVSVPAGHKLINADFSQIELRVAAFIADAKSMKEIYLVGGDIHLETAKTVTGLPAEKITKEMRTAAKAINFGFLFGMWWKTFREYAFDNYGVEFTDAEAQTMRETYFCTYPELGAWHERQKKSVRMYKGVRSPIGRFRHLPNIDSPDKDLRGEAERQAINTPVQGMASDMMLLAMIEIDRRLEANYLDKAFIVGQVHDAILVETDENIAVEVAALIKGIMEALLRRCWIFLGLTSTYLLLQT